MVTQSKWLYVHGYIDNLNVRVRLQGAVAADLRGVGFKSIKGTWSHVCYVCYVRHIRHYTACISMLSMLCMRQEEGIKTARIELDADMIIMDGYASTVARCWSQNVLGIHVKKLIIIL